MTMNDAATMISESIIDKVDMSQFYGSVKGATEFTCLIVVDDVQHDMKLNGFKKRSEKTTLLFTCQQETVSALISGNRIEKILILRDDFEIFVVQDYRLDAIDLDITYIQALNCQVKLTI